jgi:glutamate synthase (NADPH/NADH) large chain
LHRMISNHANYTNSELAKSLLNNWTDSLNYFVKVMPRDYKKVLAQRAEEKEYQVA